jgi:hypothetical protein
MRVCQGLRTDCATIAPSAIGKRGYSSTYYRVSLGPLGCHFCNGTLDGPPTRSLARTALAALRTNHIEHATEHIKVRRVKVVLERITVMKGSS